MNNHEATPEQWDKVEEWCSETSSTASCILELRTRVMALEAQASNLKGSLTSSTPPPVATDEELLEIWISEKACRPWVSRRAVYNLGVTHGQASSREVADPAPVAGERAELVADLRRMASEASAACQFNDVYTLTRAANTLQQLGEQEAGR
jgi:hypothetical protein